MGSVNKPVSGTTNAPHEKEVMLEMSTQNMFTPGTPDLTEGLDIPDVLSFATAQEHDQPPLVPNIAEPDYSDVEDLLDLGVHFGPDNLPDRGAYKEVIVEFPACMPFLSFGESITDTGLDRSEKIFTMAGRHHRALQLGEDALC